MYQRHLRNPGVSILQEVLSRVKLDEGLVRENNSILHHFLQNFTFKMKEVDDLFNLLFVEFYYTGSFYSDLRVSKPDEFDINLVLRLLHEFTIPFYDRDYSYVKLQLPNYNYTNQNFNRILSTDSCGRVSLMPSKVCEWIQSVVDRALRYFSSQNYRVISRTAGPARMVEIIKPNGEIISIDLVPVFQRELNLSACIKPEVANITGRTLKGFCIPKCHKDSDLTWRLDFPDSEKLVIHDSGCVKSVIKLLKLLRDKEGWTNLTSYNLKTVVMWMVIENRNDPYYWGEENLFTRFFEALKKLKSFVERRNIPFLFYANHNLIDHMDYSEAQKISNRSEKFIQKLSLDCNQLWNIFQ